MDTSGTRVEQQSLVRIGDAERDECMAMLTEHHVRGRLSVDELDLRHRAALAAVTQSDLEALLTDLPVGASTRRSVAVGDDWWSLDPEVRALRWVRWSVTPACLVAGGVLVANTNASSDESSFAIGLAAAALGYITHWGVSRWRPGKAD